MTKKNIHQFLPPYYQSDKIKNFMNSTTETLFTDKDSETKTYFIGRTPGGLYDPIRDYYAEEIRKSREDYQLEPALIIRDADTREVFSSTFYEDIIFKLRSNGSYVRDHKRVFDTKSYSFAPPIDYDMFVNFQNYYWYPEGVLKVRVNANPVDIIGKIEFQAEVLPTNETLWLSSGHHIVLNDDNEYIVEGVGKYITLIEFSLDDNKPKRIDRKQDTGLTDRTMFERFPKEYITMERGAEDENPWSRNNSWYHRDIVNLSIGGEAFRADRTRQAQRPIICFQKDIELYNYTNETHEYVRLFGTALDNTVDESVVRTVDESVVRTNDLVVIQGEPHVYIFDGNSFSVYSTAIEGEKITVEDGNNKANEYVWNDAEQEWKLLQQKLNPTQPILFNLYDNNDINNATLLNDEFKFPDSNFAGNKIFSYKTDNIDGFLDPELGLNIVYKSFQESSDIVFENFLETVYSYEFNDEEFEINQHYYKIKNVDLIEKDNVLLFTVHKDGDSDNIFVNDEKLPNLILKSGTQYRLDFSDTTTTVRGWKKQYTPISIKNSANVDVVPPTHGDNNQNIITFTFALSSDPAENEYVYTDGVNEGKIIITNETVSEFEFENSWIQRPTSYRRLTQRKAFTDDEDNSFVFDYIPKSDNFEIRLNGDILQANQYFFEDNTITLSTGSFSEGDYVEVRYDTFEMLSDQNDTIQTITPSLSNNPFNDDVVDFAFSEIFNHFRTAIGNQLYIEGSSLSDNNYRDTIKDRSQGNIVLKHEALMSNLHFVNSKKETSLIDSIRLSMNAYTSFKNNIVLKTEQYMANEEITKENVRDVFDRIIAEMNAGKTSREPFASSFMFATYRRFNPVEVDTNSILDRFIDLDDPKNAFYVFTNDGLKLIDVDYEIQSDSQTLETEIVPHTFALSDIIEMRYYEDMEPSFCPATPAKFGLDKPEEPRIELDETYLTPRTLIVGHDGSKTPVYSTQEEINEDTLDARDLILLELEKRIFNGIKPVFKKAFVDPLNLDVLREGYFRKTDYSLEQLRNVEFRFFNNWANLNRVDYAINRTFSEGNPWSFNYSSITGPDGERLSGHWKAIYEYFYDTDTPHITPWEMLGFKVKPLWWDNEYGSDYSSNNTALWNDLEEGIIRQGERQNTEFLRYMRSDNPYRREGLSDFIPVDSNGDLLDPIAVGIAIEPTFSNARGTWAFGDYGSVEQAWRNSSEFRFAKQIAFYLLKPNEYVSKAWNSINSYSLNDNPYPKKDEYIIHDPTNSNVVFGITQWIYEKIINDKNSIVNDLIEPFNNSEVSLAHKVGGFISSDNMRVTTESFNPRSGDVSAAIPEEDIEVILHQSNNIKESTYSGVFVERIEPTDEMLNFEKGVLYNTGDVVFNVDDKNYYKNVKSLLQLPEWELTAYYVAGRSIRFGNKAYTSLVDHSATSANNPENDPTTWELREFVDNDWAIQVKKPTSKKSVFKVYGYDIYQNRFVINPRKTGSAKRTINSLTKDSKPISTKRWEPNTWIERGEYRRLENEIFRSLEPHNTGNNFDRSKWSRQNEVPYTNITSVQISTEGSDDLQIVPYGTVFKTISEVSEFLVSYGRNLEKEGWMFDQYDSDRNAFRNWELSVREFIQWAYENREPGAVISLSPISENLRFRNTHGVPSVTRKEEGIDINLLDNYGRIVPIDNTEISRRNNVFSIKPETPLYYARLTVRETEHALVFRNRTIFNDVIYDPLYGIRKDRLRINATKSLNWNGKLEAKGFIILRDRMMPNFETSIKDIKTIANVDKISTQDIFNILKYHNLGYERRDYLQEIDMDDQAQILFYSGFIRQKGTGEAFQRLLRSSTLEADEDMGINEEWAFKEAEFGGTINNQTTEFFIDKTEIVNTPQVFELEYNDQIVNDKKPFYLYYNSNEKDRWVMSPTRFQDDGTLWKSTRLSDVKKMPTAGYVRWQDAEYKAYTLGDLNEAIRTSRRTVQSGDTSWIAKDTIEEYGFNVYKAQVDNSIVIDELITPGQDDVSSAVVRATNVSENDVYGIYQNGYYFTFKFRRLVPGEDVFIMLPLNINEFNVVDPEFDETNMNDFTYFIWKSIRVNKYYEPIFDDVQDTIDQFITNSGNLEVSNGMKLYIDDAKGRTSFKELTLSGSPTEYWTLDNFDGSVFEGSVSGTQMIPFEGSVSGTQMIPDDVSDMTTDVQGLLFGSSGVSGVDTFDPSTSTWPNAIWAEMGSQALSEHSFNMWFNTLKAQKYNFIEGVSTTIGAKVFANPVSGKVYTIQVMIDSPVIGQDNSYKVVLMVDGNIEDEIEIQPTEGFNNATFNIEFDSNGVNVQPYINGSFTGGLTSNDTNHSGDFNSFVVIADNTEKGSGKIAISHVSIYDRHMTLSEIQELYEIGKQSVFSDNDQGYWGVYKYDGSQWTLDYKEEPVIDTNLIKNVQVYDNGTRARIGYLDIHDPVKGMFAGSNINEVDFITSYDPAEYNNENDLQSRWTDNKVGTLWLNTSKFRYLEYENFDVETKTNFWGSLFPGSEIEVCEWIKSSVPPSDFERQDMLIDPEKFVTSSEYNILTNTEVEYYYFWVVNNNEVPENLDRNISALNISNSIRFVNNNNVNYIAFMDDYAFFMSDITNDIVQQDVVLQINYRLDDEITQTHKQWYLMSENDVDIPEYLFEKMTDSLLGYTRSEDAQSALEVPDPGLSNANRYGNDVLPRKTWFKNAKKAREIFFEVINDELRKVNVWDAALFWEQIVEDVQRDTDVYELVDWIDESFDPETIITNKANDRNEMTLIPLADGEYISIDENVGRMPSVYEPGQTVFRYDAENDSYIKVYQTRSAFNFKEEFYTRDLTEEEAFEVRKLFDVIFNFILVGENASLKPEVFFALVNHVFVEQPNNDWVYPTTFISINQSTNSLIRKRVYRPDREDEIVKYVNEAKPFHTKLRTINITHTRDAELANLFVTDFDKPPFINETKAVLNLQEYITETIRYTPVEYYIRKVDISMPLEYWTMNDIAQNENIEGKNGTIITYNSGLYETDDGISFGKKLCTRNEIGSGFSFESDTMTSNSNNSTIEFWFTRPDNVVFNGDKVFFESEYTNSGVSTFVRLIGKENSGVLEYFVTFENTSNATIREIPIVMTLTNNHIVIQITDSNTIRVTTNTQLSDTETLTGSAVLNGAEITLRFGHESTDSDEFACYDHIAVYTRNISSTEIIRHFNGGASATQNEFELEKVHDTNSLEVYIEGQKWPTNQLTVSQFLIVLSQEPSTPVNHYKNIIVRSKNLFDHNIIQTWDKTRGYASVDQNNMNEWKSLVNQKHTRVTFDRISLLPTFSLEYLLESYDEIQSSDEPLLNFTKKTMKFTDTSEQKYSTIDRIVVHYYYDELKEVVENSFVEIVSSPFKKNFNIGSDFDKENIVVFVNDVEIDSRFYSVSESSGDLTVKMKTRVYKDQSFKVRVKDEYVSLVEKAYNKVGVGIPYHNIKESFGIGFDINNNSSPVQLDQNGDLVLNQDYLDELEDADKTASLVEYTSEFDNNSDNVLNGGDFLNPADRGVPEEFVGAKAKESLVFTFKNNLNIVPRGYETTKPLDIFETVSFESTGSETEYPIVLNVPDEQVILLVDDEEWIPEHHYTLETDKIVFNKSLTSGQKVVITDRYSAFDRYRDKQLYIHKNIQAGGFDGDMVMPEFLNDKPEFREFVVYDHLGKVFAFTCDEDDSVELTNDLGFFDKSLTVDSVNDKFKPVNNEHGKLVAVVGIIENNGIIEKTSVEFILYKEIDGNELKDITRGIFNTYNKYFSSEEYTTIKVYPLEIEKDLPSFTIMTPYIGLQQKDSYPKYGYIMSGKDE